MPLNIEALPFITPFDPTEEPAGSVDPLGLLTYAERLADILLPGFTARMWRPRFLTFSVLSTIVSDRVNDLMPGDNNSWIEARLAFERLFVSSIVRMYTKDPNTYEQAKLSVPGTRLALRAFDAGVPLTRNNFLKGQTVNGPSGVINRLARELKLINNDGDLGQNGRDLLLAWSKDQNLPGILDEKSSERNGAVWITDMARAVAAWISKHDWPGSGHRIWERLTTCLRPDLIGKQERAFLLKLLKEDAVRRRTLELLQHSTDTYRSASKEGRRGLVESSVLLQGVKPFLSDSHVDRLIKTAIRAIDTYESVAALFQETFDGVAWVLRQHSLQAVPDTLLADPRLDKHLKRIVTKLGKRVPVIEQIIKDMQNTPTLDDSLLIEPMKDLLEETKAGSYSTRKMVEFTLNRHERIQREKQKSLWIDRGQLWTLISDFRSDEDCLTIYIGYIHPFRITNAYSFLSDLNQVSIRKMNIDE
jgi:hypothetical protein